MTRSRMRTRAAAVVAGVLAGGAIGAVPANAAGHTVYDAAVASTFVVGSVAADAPSNIVRIQRGDTVEWVNLDPISHDVTFKDHSYPLQGWGATAKRTFRKTGAFSFHCTIHPGMTGLVYVSDGAPY